MKIIEKYSPQNSEIKYEEFGSWKVSKNGDMDYKERYFIDGNRLLEEDWVAHLFEKGWIDFN